MFYVLALMPAVMMSIAIARFWQFLRRLGYAWEIIGRAPGMLALDGISLLMAALTGCWCLCGWFDVALPIFQSGPMPEWRVTVMATVVAPPGALRSRRP